MLFHDVENGNGLDSTIATVSGTVSVNTCETRGQLQFLYVKATTPTTQFDFKMTDNKGRVVRHYTGETGIIRDVEELPMLGIYTLSVESATADEEFYIFLRMEQT
jgi:hypothetical protein